MVWYAAKYNQTEPARGNSGLRPFCVPTLAGSFIGDRIMKRIPLTQGKFAMVDAKNFDWLNQWKWQTHKSGNTYYAVRCIGKQPNRHKLLMHREILNIPKGMNTDHINHKGFDNRRCNIRACTQKQNCQNRQLRRGESSKYKGVSWHKKVKKWRAYISCPQIHLGLFNNEIMAAKRYDEKAKELFGEFAYTNF